MTLIDARGRLFGRFNLIDVTVALFVVVLVPMGYVAYRVFRVPQPVITSVSPATLTVDAPRRVQLHGERFRPYLQAYLGKTGVPFSLVNRIESQHATLLTVTPSLVEIEFPAVGPGTYDVHLFDLGQEVTSITGGFTIVGPPASTVEVLARFLVTPDMVPLVREGDRDRWEQEGANVLAPSELATMGPVHATKEPVTITTGRGTWAGIALEAIVRIPAKKRTLGGWEYKSDRIRAGESLIFETERYRIFGLIERVTELPGAPPAPEGGK